MQYRWIPLKFTLAPGLVLAAMLAACSVAAPTVTTKPTTAPSSSAAPAPAAVGGTISLHGDDAGELVAVTLVKVITDAKPATSFDHPPKGDRLYAAQFRLSVTGSAAYSDSPSNGAVVTDGAGQSYQAAFDSASQCAAFPATEKIAPGGSGLGCVVFEVPKSAVITQVQFTLDSGFGPQTGQWKA